MKSERRQDLRTNELSHHLDAVRDYARENATVLTIIVVVAAVLVGAGFTYAKWQNDRRMEAWDAVENANPAADASKAIQDLEAVAAQNVTPGATAAALLKIAETALHQNALPSAADKDLPTSAPAAKPVDWAAKAEATYNEILKRFPNDKIATGQALLALGLLAEGKGDLEKARTYYKKVADDKQYLHTALVSQAHYRLLHLDEWAKPVVFPPPQMTVPIPEGMEKEAFTIPSEPASPAAAQTNPPSAPGAGK